MNINSLSLVPNEPGVYLWKDKYDRVIYIGKAKKLKQRMSQYFKGAQNSYKTNLLIKNIFSFEYIITKNDREALILERNLIEKYTPEYNIKLTDDKRYPYIWVRLTNKLEITLVYRIRSINKKTGILYGPFPAGYGARRMVNLLNRISIYKNGIPNRTTDIDHWKNQFKYVKNILSTGMSSLISELKKKMEIASENMHYEVAHEIKESLKALSFYKENQSVEIKDHRNIDAIGMVEKDGYLSLSILFYRQGVLLHKLDKVIEIINSKEESISQFISQYYKINLIPEELLINESFETNLNTFIPKKGSKKQILNLATQNAKDNLDIKLSEFLRKEELTLGAVSELAKILSLETCQHIIMIDNSSFQNTNPVSVIVSYRNGIKQRQEYRKYNLETNHRMADVEYMQQGIQKYFKHNAYPDLLIVDGGKAQINAVKEVTNNIPIIGLVKDDKHKTRNILDEKGNVIDAISSNLFNFLSGMQREVDLFAKQQHSSRRRVATLEGVLSNVKGVGVVTEKKLLNKFKTYSAIYNASIEELSSIISIELAHRIKEVMKWKKY